MKLNKPKTQIDLAIQFLYYIIASLGGIALGFILGVTI